MVVNFSINNSYIQNTIRLEILKSEEYETYEQVINTNDRIEESRAKQEENKIKLLDILKTNENILENDEVIETLKSIQEDYSHIEEQKQTLENEFQNFQEKINGFNNLSQKIIKIWFILENLNISHKMYR